MKIESNGTEKNSGSAYRSRIVDVSFTFNVINLHSVSKPVVRVKYNPLIADVNGNINEYEMLGDSIEYDLNDVPCEVRQKLEGLERGLVRLLPSYELGGKGSDLAILVASVRGIAFSYRSNPPVKPPDVLNLSYFFPTRAGHVIGTALSWDSLSRSEQLLVSNVASWVKKQAWEHLTKKVREASGEPVVSSRSYKVFVSYKKKSRAEEIAETIAERLSEQGINVWFDKWEVKAGDSIPGKIEEGFKESDACIIFLSHEYGGSNWCKKEMRTALVKAIEENFTVIPSLVGVCDVPELLKDLRRVDFIKKPKATEFEQKLQEITDAIYKVDLNPYR